MKNINSNVFLDQIARKSTDIGSFLGFIVALPLVFLFVQNSTSELEYLFLISLGILLICQFCGWSCGWIIGLLAMSSDENVKKN